MKLVGSAPIDLHESVPESRLRSGEPQIYGAPGFHGKQEEIV